VFSGFRRGAPARLFSIISAAAADEVPGSPDDVGHAHASRSFERPIEGLF